MTHADRLEEEADSGDEALDALGMVRPGRGKSGAKPESQKRNVKEERDIRFYGVSPEWIYKSTSPKNPAVSSALPNPAAPGGWFDTCRQSVTPLCVGSC